MIERCSTIDQPGWLELREALWPDCLREEHFAEMALFVAEPQKYVQFLAYNEAKLPVGFVEASLRTDYVNGTSTSPVAFLEGLYVVPESRRKGIATKLVGAVASWAVSAGCSEFASDVLLENELSHSVHTALGFVETERVVFFRKQLR